MGGLLPHPQKNCVDARLGDAQLGKGEVELAHRERGARDGIGLRVEAQQVKRAGEIADRGRQENLRLRAEGLRGLHRARDIVIGDRELSELDRAGIPHAEHGVHPLLGDRLRRGRGRGGKGTGCDRFKAAHRSERSRDEE